MNTRDSIADFETIVDDIIIVDYIPLKDAYLAYANPFASVSAASIGGNSGVWYLNIQEFPTSAISDGSVSSMCITKTRSMNYFSGSNFTSYYQGRMNGVISQSIEKGQRDLFDNAFYAASYPISGMNEEILCFSATSDENSFIKTAIGEDIIDFYRYDKDNKFKIDNDDSVPVSPPQSMTWDELSGGYKHGFFSVYPTCVPSVEWSNALLIPSSVVSSDWKFRMHDVPSGGYAISGDAYGNLSSAAEGTTATEYSMELTLPRIERVKYNTKASLFGITGEIDKRDGVVPDVSTIPMGWHFKTNGLASDLDISVLNAVSVVYPPGDITFPNKFSIEINGSNTAPSSKSVPVVNLISNDWDVYSYGDNSAAASGKYFDFENMYTEGGPLTYTIYNKNKITLMASPVKSDSVGDGVSYVEGINGEEISTSLIYFYEIKAVDESGRYINMGLSVSDIGNILFRYNDENSSQGITDGAKRTRIFVNGIGGVSDKSGENFYECDWDNIITSGGKQYLSVPIYDTIDASGNFRVYVGVLFRDDANSVPAKSEYLNKVISGFTRDVDINVGDFSTSVNETVLDSVAVISGKILGANYALIKIPISGANGDGYAATPNDFATGLVNVASAGFDGTSNGNIIVRVSLDENPNFGIGLTTNSRKSISIGNTAYVSAYDVRGGCIEISKHISPVTARGIIASADTYLSGMHEVSVDGVYYGDLNETILHYNEGSNWVTSGLDVEGFSLGKKYDVYATGDEDSGKYRYVLLFEAYHVPEVSYIDDLALSIYPEYCCEFETPNSVKWYKNGYSIKNGMFDFGNQYNFGQYVFAGGKHKETVFFRIPFGNELSGYYGKINVYTNSTDDDSKWAFIGGGKCAATSAAQFEFVSPKSVGSEERVNYRTKIELDLVRPDGTLVFDRIPKTYKAHVNDEPVPRNLEFRTQIYEKGIADIKNGDATYSNGYCYGPSYIPMDSFVHQSDGKIQTNMIYFPVGGLVGTTVYDERVRIPSGGSCSSIDSASALDGEGLWANSLFDGNILGIWNGDVSVTAPAISMGGYKVEYWVAALAHGKEDQVVFEPDETTSDSILWSSHGMIKNTGVIGTFKPTYYVDEEWGIERNNYTKVVVSAERHNDLKVVASVPGNRSFDGMSYYCSDWDGASVMTPASAEKYLWSPPRVKFVTPVVIANRNSEGYIPWYNESEVSAFNYFDVCGTNTNVVQSMSPAETVYKMSGFEDAGYYGIGASGYVSACEMDNLASAANGDRILRVKKIMDEYYSKDDIWVETFETWSSAVLRTPLSQKITLDYNITDLNIGPNELITNDVINRRFEMLQHDLEQVQSISKYYKNPPTMYLGYVGYNFQTVPSSDYSMYTEVEIGNHYGFWGAGEDGDKNRLDWWWCWSSSGEFVCPSARNTTLDKDGFRPTIVYGANDVFIDDATMNIYATSGSTFTLGGMSTYTQVYQTSADEKKFRDYAEVNGTAPKITSIKVMDDGTVVVLAPEFNRVLLYSRFNDDDIHDRKDLVFKYDFGGLGGANSNLRFNSPIDLAIDNGKHSKWGQLIYVLDAGNDCVKVFNVGGAFISKINYATRKWADEYAIGLDVSVEGTICILTKFRVMFYNIDGEFLGDFTLDRNDPIQICRNKNSNFVYVLYDDDVLKISATGLYIGNFSVSNKWHRLGGYRQGEIPPYFGKFRRMATTKFDQIYLVMDNIVLIYADLLTEMSLAASGYKDMQWSLDEIKIGRNEYMQDFVVNIALHRMYDNINLFRKAIYGTLRVYEKNGIKYLRTNNLSEGEFALMNEIPAKGDIFIPSNAPMSSRAFNDNFEKLYGIIFKLLEWCQTALD